MERDESRVTAYRDIHVAITMENYTRNLPHWLPADSIFFVTFRLANSLPKNILDELFAEREREEKNLRLRFQGDQLVRERYIMNKKHFGKYDDWLDQCLAESPRWLAQGEVARMVMQEIQRLDGERYRMLAFCIMPNHVHLLVDMHHFNQTTTTNQAGATRSYPLTDALRLLKGRTARYCNQLLGRTGQFWHHESYDHVVRDENELERICAYILENPVKANLARDKYSWPYTVIRV
jgi:putative transposase